MTYQHKEINVYMQCQKIANDRKNEYRNITATNVALNLPAVNSVALYKKPFHWLILLRHLARSLNVIERKTDETIRRRT